MIKSIISFLVWITLSSISVSAQQITGLNCNYDKKPIALDDLHPRLSWQLVATERDVTQEAYQILVASSLSKLSQNIGDMWDSKKVISEQSQYVPYKGNKLLSAKKYYWKVRVWSKNKALSAWSETACWQMGLLQPSDWKAQWITASKWYTPPTYRPTGLELGDKGGWADIDLGTRSVVELVKLFPLDSASFPEKFRILGSNEFNFVYHDILVDQTKEACVVKDKKALSFRVKPASYRYIRLEILANNQKKYTIVRQLEVFSGGKNVALMKFAREYNTSWAAGHATFLVDGMPSQNEGKVCPPDACPSVAAPLLSKTFTLDKKIKSATVYFAALGMADVSINGQKIGNDELGPPFTDYYKRIMYVTYDVTNLVRQGQNAIGAILANGFFSTPSGGFGHRHNGNGPPRFLLQTLITYTDGSQERIVTDSSWKWAKSEVVFNDVWQGYTEDRHLTKPGWDKPGYKDLDWAGVEIAEKLPGKLVSRSGPPNRINGFIKPESVKDNHAYFKTLTVGWPLLKLNGKAGQVVTITSGNETSMGSIKFILAKNGLTTLSPRFTIQPGPTDIKVDGLTSPLKAEDICIQYVNADLKSNSSFKCSNSYLDTLYDVTVRTHRNYINDVPADPNRERQGWTQDAQNMFNTAAYLTDVRDLYSRWWNDMADNQDDQGYLGSVVPVVNRQVYDWNSPWWSGVIVYLPWEHYQYYGNVEMLEKSYGAMCRYLDLLNRIAETGDGVNWDDYTFFTNNLDSAAAKEKMLVWNGPADCGNPYIKNEPSAASSKKAPTITMPAWYHYATVVSKAAAVLGKEADARKYAALAKDIKDRFNKKYYNSQTGLYGDSTNNQTNQVLPLAVGIVPDGKEELTYQRLIDAIHQRGDHLGTGFVALPYLLKELAYRRDAVTANIIVNKQDYPSWKTLMREGVLRETWHGDFAQMPSCGGAIGAWLFQSVLGIQPDEHHPGFKAFIVAPQPDKASGLTSAKGHYECGYGKIAVEWKCENGKFILDVSVPGNTSARLAIPADEAGSISESGQLLQKVKPVTLSGFDKDVATILLKSGTYHFETKYAL